MKKIKKIHGDKNENKMFQNLCEAVKAVLRGIHF